MSVGPYEADKSVERAIRFSHTIWSKSGSKLASHGIFRSRHAKAISASLKLSTPGVFFIQQGNDEGRVERDLERHG